MHANDGESIRITSTLPLPVLAMLFATNTESAWPRAVKEIREVPVKTVVGWIVTRAGGAVLKAVHGVRRTCELARWLPTKASPRRYGEKVRSESSIDAFDARKRFDGHCATVLARVEERNVMAMVALVHCVVFATETLRASVAAVTVMDAEGPKAPPKRSSLYIPPVLQTEKDGARIVMAASERKFTLLMVSTTVDRSVAKLMLEAVTSNGP